MRNCARTPQTTCSSRAGCSATWRRTGTRSCAPSRCRSSAACRRPATHRPSSSTRWRGWPTASRPARPASPMIRTRAALGACRRPACAVVRRARSRLRKRERASADRHDRLPRRRLLRTGQRALDPRSPKPSPSATRTWTNWTTWARSTCTSAAASTPAATTTAATSASSASTRTARSGIRSRSAAPTAPRSAAPRRPARWSALRSRRPRCRR